MHSQAEGEIGMESQSGKDIAGWAVDSQKSGEPAGGLLDEEIDLSLLKDSLAKTPWERMQANDDALNFAESLRKAMSERNAKSQ